MNDLKFAVRQLLKNPGFTGVALLTLALGIGANTAIFSFVYTILLKPLPYANPDRLVQLFENNVVNGWRKNAIGARVIGEWRRQAKVFEGITARVAPIPRLTAVALVTLGTGVVANAAILRDVRRVTSVASRLRFLDFHSRNQRHVQKIETVVLAVEHDQCASWGSQNRKLRMADGKRFVTGQVKSEWPERRGPEQRSEFVGTHAPLCATVFPWTQAGSSLG